jgi:hypothetical protein
MKRDWLYIGLVIVVFFFMFAVYVYIKDINSNINSTFESFSSLNGNSKDNKLVSQNNNPENTMPDSNKVDDNSPAGGDSGRSSGSSAGSANANGFENNSNPEERLNQSSCSLIRPGNLPDINCFVNYIKTNSVSLKIENKLGEDIGIMMNLNTCSPQLQNTIKDNEQKDFVFSCNNNDYFSQDILISYFLSGNGTVNIGGFVNGYVSG